MCGKSNRYGHPHPETLSKFQQAGVTIFRTDLNGNIIVKSDGNGISVSTERTCAQPLAGVKQTIERKQTPTVSSSQQIYIGNRNSKAFHLSGCSSVKQMND